MAPRLGKICDKVIPSGVKTPQAELTAFNRPATAHTFFTGFHHALPVKNRVAGKSRARALPATLPQQPPCQGSRGPFHSSGAPGFLSAVSWPARSEQQRDARGTPDLSSANAFGRSFSCDTLRSWACQEANQLCRSRSLQNPMTTFEPGRFLRLAQLSQVSQVSQHSRGRQDTSYSKFTLSPIRPMLERYLGAGGMAEE